MPRICQHSFGGFKVAVWLPLHVAGVFTAMQIIDARTCALLGEVDIVPDGWGEFEPRTPCRVEVWSSPFKLGPIEGQHILNDLREFDRNWSIMTAVMAFMCPTKLRPQ